MAENICFSCVDACEECSEADRISCTVCSPGFYLQPNTRICLPQCPTSFAANSVTRTCDTVTGEVFCQAFDLNKTYFTTAAERTGSIVSTYGGSKIEAELATDPIPIYKRGFWFDGAQYATIDNLILNTSFTIKLWVRPTS